jgi:hypothetical protein
MTEGNKEQNNITRNNKVRKIKNEVKRAGNKVTEEE